MSAPTRSRTGPDRAPDRAAPRRGSDALRAPLAGAVAALAAIGLSELVAGFLGGPSLLAAIGEFVIDHQPPGAKDLVVGVFGTNDKLALEGLIVVVATIVGAGLGLVAVHRSFAIAAGAFGAFAVAGFFAALGSPEAGGSGRPPEPRRDRDAAGRRRDLRARDHAAGRAERPVLPDRHRAHRPERRRRYVAAAHPRDGRPGGQPVLHRSVRAAAVRAVRDDRLRQ